MFGKQNLGFWARWCAVIFGTIIVLFGCGGGGGGGVSASPVTASISVAWPLRSLAINGPASGLSVKFVLHDPTGKQTDLVWTGNRSSVLSPHTETYTSAVNIKPGKFVLSGAFYASADELGSLVATFGTDVSVTSRGTVANQDGTPLQPVKFTGTVRSVTIAAGQTVHVGSNSTQIAASAQDANGGLIAVSPGSFVFSVTNGQAYLRLTSSGVASGIATGTASVSASVDGVVATPVSVSVVGSANTSVTVAWPERSRSIAGSSSALSVKLILHDPAGAQSDLIWSGDRSAALAAHSETYQAGSQCNTGAYTLTGNFYSDSALGGIPVANFSVSVAVQADGSITKPDGSNLGVVQFSGVIQSVAIPSGQVVQLGTSSNQLTVGAFDSSGSPVAVSPGSFIFTVTSGGSNLSVTKSGIATGSHVGTATVIATIDGLTSPTATITVGASQTGIQSYNLSSNDIAYDSARNLLYVSTASDSPVSPSAIVPINLTTNQIGTAISIGRVPTALALSGDGSHLFIGSDSGIITRLNLASLAVDGAMNVYTMVQGLGGQIINRLFTLPGTSDSFVVLTLDSNYSPRPNNLAIIDSGVARLHMASLGPQVSIDNTGTQAFGTDDYITPNGFSSATIDAQGFVPAAGGSLGELGAGTTVCWTPSGVASGGFLGMPVMSPTTGQQIGNLSNLPGYKMMAWEPGTSKVFYAYWASWLNPYLQVQTEDIAALTTVGAPVSIGNPSGGVGKIVYAGSNRAAIRMYNGTPNSVIVVGGLP